MWHTVTDIRRDESENGLEIFEARAETPADSPWFSGHFPGEPILPGIAQLHMVLEVVRTAMPEGFRLAGVRRVRFKQVVRPEEPLTVSVRPDAGNRSGAGESRWSFQIKRNDDIACVGALIVEPLENRQEGEPAQ